MVCAGILAGRFSAHFFAINRRREKLAHKYAEELHCNEVAILPYYVANLNIEATYAAITHQYAEFPNRASSIR